MKLTSIMKRKKASIQWVTILTILLVGYTNCSQPGEIVQGQKTSEDASAMIPNGNTPGGGNPPGSSNPPGGNPPGGGSNPPVIEYQSMTKTVEVQNIKQKVDILVVIDNSASMATEQKNMAMRFNTFIDQLSGLDWHIGITTTDVAGTGATQDGRLQNYKGLTNVAVLTSQMDINVVKQAFADTVQMAAIGSSDEQGIKATYRALERSLDVNSPNAGLIRTDAALAVIVVTDADETAPTPTVKNTPDGLLNYIKTTWNSTKVLSFHSIVVKDGDSVCKSKDGNEGYGLSYISLSQKTNGIIGSVCETDYGTQLKAMGQQVQALVKSIRLDCTPVDADGDAMLDIVITNNNAQPIPPYQLVSNDLVFSTSLPVGVTTVQYKCIK